MQQDAQSAWSGVERRYGPFAAPTVKPCSKVQRSLDGGSLVKIYRGVEPEARRLREAEALGLGARHGLSVPTVLATGQNGGQSWLVFEAVPGEPCVIGTEDGVREYLNHVVAVMDRLHRPVDGLSPGPGWGAEEYDESWTLGCYLLGQLSERCRRKSWWTTLRDVLSHLESHPTVLLHGDLKPEHVLVDNGLVHVVDWEASGRGPAVLDHADVAYHLVRDLIYTDVRSRGVPTDLLSQLSLNGPALAWRVVRWLDRRRPSDVDLVSEGDIRRLAAADSPAAVSAELFRLISLLRDFGVPR